MKNLFAFIFIGLLWVASPVQAKQYKIALAHMPPYAMKTEQGISGILVDIAKEAFSRLEYDVRFEFYPWPRAIEYVKRGRVDGITPFFKSKEREKFAYFFGNGLLDMKLHFFKKKESKIIANEIEDVMAYRIVKVDKASLGSHFANLEEKNLINVEYVPNTTIGLKLLVSDRVDLLASVKTIAEYVAKNISLSDEIETTGKAFDTHKPYLAFSRESTSDQLGKEIAAQIDLMEKDGTIRKIYQRYMK